MNEEFENEIGREYNKFLTQTDLKATSTNIYIQFRIMKALESIAVTLEEINDKTNHIR